MRRVLLQIPTPCSLPLYHSNAALGPDQHDTGAQICRPSSLNQVLLKEGSGGAG